MADSDFEITTQEFGDKVNVTVVNVNGFLDAHTFDLMENTLENLLKQHKRFLVINLEYVDYISSAGAGVFIGAQSKAEELGGAIVLMNPHPSVKEIFDILGLSTIFTFVKSFDEAKKFFQTLG